MMTEAPKTVRRRILTTLYERFLQFPAEMMGADDLMSIGAFTRADMVVNMYYLADSGLVEMITSYRPNWFEAARILPPGIDLVENPLLFDLRFPPEIAGAQEDGAAVVYLAERLVEEADFAAIDGEARMALLRDVRYLRDELARPRDRWRHEVVDAALRWMENAVSGVPDAMPSLTPLRQALEGRRPDPEA